MPAISVIIAAYNSQSTISETISSVLNQTFSDLEVIVIDDGSTDLTRDRVKEIADQRVKLFPYQNGGVAKARNRGLAHATGEYIAFLDHDDLWVADKLEAQLSAIQQSDRAEVAYSWTINMYSEEQPVRFVECPGIDFKGDVYEQILASNFVGSGSNILVSRQAIASVGEFDSVPVSNEDWDFYIRLAAKWHFALVPKYQVIYRHAANSMSSQVKRLETGGIILADKAYQAAPDNLQYLKSRFLYNHFVYCSEVYLDNYCYLAGKSEGDLLEGYRALGTAIRFLPWGIFKTSTYRLILKLLLTSILPSEFMFKLKKIKQGFDETTPDPRSNQ
ncbi:MAG: glycosyltransferase family 2 protein [Cyanobacteria bacterium J06643_13]